MNPGEVLIQSYVLEKFFVSTIYRDSSAAIDPHPYFETMVWPWNKEKRQREDHFVGQHDSGYYAKQAMTKHHEICVALASADISQIP